MQRLWGGSARIAFFGIALIMRGLLVVVFLAAAGAAHVPMPQHVMLVSDLDKIFEENEIDMPKEETITLIKEELDDNAAAQDWDDVQNFMGDYPNQNDIVIVSRTFLLWIFVIIPLITLLIALFYPMWYSYIHGDSTNASAKESKPSPDEKSSKANAARDAAPVIVIKKHSMDEKPTPVAKPSIGADLGSTEAAQTVSNTAEDGAEKSVKDTDGAEAGAPVSAPLYAADDQLPEEHLSLIFARIATSHPSKVCMHFMLETSEPCLPAFPGHRVI